MKIGLVLEGGAMRGMYTAGVLDMFLEHGIVFDCIVGVSAGALFGVNYLSEQSGRVIRYNKRFNRDKNYMGLLPLLREGNIFSTKYAYEDVPHRLDPFDDLKYKQSDVPFYAVLTDVKSGMPKYIRIRSVFEQMDTLRASGSMPFVSKPVPIDGGLYLDGGISDSIPFRWLLNNGCDKLTVILTRDTEYRKKPMPKILANSCKRKYPRIAECLSERHISYNRNIEELNNLEKEGKAFIIRPSEPIKISRIEKDPQKLQAVYDLGKKDFKAVSDSLKAFIAKKE
ncbi:MAG: patatin family protein [Firmicutes bacterium]|nr:patatin family protein [[Eubacterium] siraeum]MCM1487840.1 patatin family protein [Bacillota bacterium]